MEECNFEKIIQFLKGKEHLYFVGHKKYKNISDKLKECEEFGQTLVPPVNGSYILAKIKYIKAQIVKTKQALMARRGQASSCGESTVWCWYEATKFMHYAVRSNPQIARCFTPQIAMRQVTPQQNTDGREDISRFHSITLKTYPGQRPHSTTTPQTSPQPSVSSYQQSPSLLAQAPHYSTSDQLDKYKTKIEEDLIDNIKSIGDTLNLGDVINFNASVTKLMLKYNKNVV